MKQNRKKNILENSYADQWMKNMIVLITKEIKGHCIAFIEIICIIDQSVSNGSKKFHTKTSNQKGNKKQKQKQNKNSFA